MHYKDWELRIKRECCGHGCSYDQVAAHKGSFSISGGSGYGISVIEQLKNIEKIIDESVILERSKLMEILSSERWEIDMEALALADEEDEEIRWK